MKNKKVKKATILHKKMIFLLYDDNIYHEKDCCLLYDRITGEFGPQCSLQCLSPSHFTPSSLPQFLEATSWLTSIFNSLSFSLFPTDSLSFAQTVSSSSIPFHQPLLQTYIQYRRPLKLQVDTSTINPHHSISEPQSLSSNTCFDDWF